jgi:methionyl-tRNA synthetase
MRLATEVNKYLDKTAPWFEIKSNKDNAAKSIYTALRAIDSLKILFAAFLPFTCERLNSYLGFSQPLFGEQFLETVTDNLGEHTVLRYRPANASGNWRPSQLPAGQALNQPQALFRKLDPSVAAEERARIGY